MANDYKDDRIDMRELDDAFNKVTEKRIETEREEKNVVGAAILMTIVYSIVTTVIYGMFFYRGGLIEVGVGGYLLDLIVIGFIVYAVTYEQGKNKPTEIFFGTILLTGGDVLAKSFILYPTIIDILGMN